MLLFSGNVDKRTILQMYDSVAILIDETVDDGIILETDSGVIRNRVSNLPESDPVLNIEINEKTVSKVNYGIFLQKYLTLTHFL